MRANVVSVPLRAVIEKNGTEVVRVLKGDGKTYDEKPVTTGMEGEGGNIEVTGVGSGTTVIVLIKE
jgi:multidrug efflux pump subunit AcrA (membrane-fusion protein)